jgi:hypothetical protein
MEPTTQADQQQLGDFYQYGADLLIQKRKSEEDAKAILQGKGVSAYDAAVIIDTLSARIKTERKARAKKDILYGALWCGGGTVLTLAHIGFIFWGAIIFGGIQLVRGLINS